MKNKIDKLIINSPYSEPTSHWSYNRESQEFELKKTRRPAGYLVASKDSKSFDDPGIFVEIPLVNAIRDRVKLWRNNGYPGVTGITKRLLEYWNDQNDNSLNRFFFCQLEAIETLIWLLEAPDSEKVGIDIPKDGGNIQRLCAKMATGSGKTVVMGMVIAWNILNKVSNPRDSRFSKNILVVAPGLTVRDRLSVLNPQAEPNYFRDFSIVPSAYFDKLQQGKVIIRNWHTLNWETEDKIRRRKSVDKRGALSDEAYVRSVLGELAQASNLVVINDEAHHAWRNPTETKVKGLEKSDIEKATKWIGGLDRIDKVKGIITCYDFSATPFVPSGKTSTEESLFDWIVCDFGLNDAIESGLVKTPRVVVRDDAIRKDPTYMSRLYHIYNDPEVKDDLNRDVNPDEPLPNLVKNGYELLGQDWLETKKEWESSSHASTPPVMITVTNRTETAARVKYAFDKNMIKVDQLCDPNFTLHIDSKVLKQAEEVDEPIADIEGVSKNGTDISKFTQNQSAEMLRRQVDTVGKKGMPGEQIQNVISVQMLSEGWDAKTVTHIMGLRAFSSQLLCEQVVGRGLRRTSYELNANGLLDPEYVNIFGVPFTFLPHESDKDTLPPPPKPTTLIETVQEKTKYAIEWPNIVRIDHNLQTQFSLNWEDLEPLELDASDTIQLAKLAPIVDNKPDLSNIEEIKLEDQAKKFRIQQIIFETSRDIFHQMESKWEGDKSFLLGQLVSLVEKFIKSDRIRITPKQFSENETKKRLVLSYRMHEIVSHICNAIKLSKDTTLEPIFDRVRPILSTADMQSWYTSKPCELTQHSHINKCVFDSTWEATDAHVLDNSKKVFAWAKNDHLDFEIYYVYKGAVKKYRPDFLIKLINGEMLILETKGKETDRDKVKFQYLNEWVSAVNSWTGLGKWHCAVSRNPGEASEILSKFC